MSTEEQREQWNQRFSKNQYLFGTEPNAFLASQQHLLRAGQSALAVADGEGRNGVWLAKLGLDVLSIDFSGVALEKARKLAAQNGVTLRTEMADLCLWDWGQERFDVVVAIFIQFAAPHERTLLFSNMKKCLKPSGYLILQGYRPQQIEYKTGGPPQAENMYTTAVLQEHFGDMTILHLREHDNLIAEGTGHQGLSALIDLIACK